MKILFNVTLAVLIFLAVSSGVMKILLMEQEVMFFGEYGFTDTILMLFGAIQLMGGILMVLSKTRLVGALIVAITFFISAVLLVKAVNIPVAGLTFLLIAVLGWVMNKSIKEASSTS